MEIQFFLRIHKKKKKIFCERRRRRRERGKGEEEHKRRTPKSRRKSYDNPVERHTSVGLQSKYNHAEGRRRDDIITAKEKLKQGTSPHTLPLWKMNFLGFKV